MKSLPKLVLMPRARRELRKLLRFVGNSPWGTPADRERDVRAALDRIAAAPFSRPICKGSRPEKLGLRRHYVRQFVIIYAYIGDVANYPDGEISVRSIRHYRERNVLWGVNEATGHGSTAPLQTTSEERILQVTLIDQHGIALEVNVERYNADADYRDGIHEAMNIAPGQEPLDWDYICASEEELAARGEKPLFTTADYPDEESANKALKQFLELLASDCDDARRAN